MFSRINLITFLSKTHGRHFHKGPEWRAAKNPVGEGQKGESERMKKFHEKLKSETGPSGGPGMQLDDLVLVETDPKSGETIANSEKDPTKWGDWQNGGRVSDF